MLTNDEQTRLKATIANNLWMQKSYHEHNSHKKKQSAVANCLPESLTKKLRGFNDNFLVGVD